MNITQLIKRAVAKLGIKVQRSEYHPAVTIQIGKLAIVIERDTPSALYGLYYNYHSACTLATFDSLLGRGATITTTLKRHTAHTHINYHKDSHKLTAESKHYLFLCWAIARIAPRLAQYNCTYNEGHTPYDMTYSKTVYAGRIKPFPTHMIVEWDF